MNITVVGGPGGIGNGSSGGAGANVTATVNVEPGQVLDAEVAGAGSAYNAGTSPDTGGIGGGGGAAPSRWRWRWRLGREAQRILRLWLLAAVVVVVTTAYQAAMRAPSALLAAQVAMLAVVAAVRSRARAGWVSSEAAAAAGRQRRRWCWQRRKRWWRKRLRWWRWWWCSRGYQRWYRFGERPSGGAGTGSQAGRCRRCERRQRRRAEAMAVMAVVVSASVVVEAVTARMAEAVRWLGGEAEGTDSGSDTSSGGGSSFAISSATNTSSAQSVLSYGQVTISYDPVADACPYFTVVARTTATAGRPFNVTVTAFTGLNATDVSYAGNLSFTSSDPSTALPAGSALTNGTGTFPTTLKPSARKQSPLLTRFP